MKSCNPAFCEKNDRSKAITDKYWQKDILNSKFNVESNGTLLLKKKDGVDFRYFRKCQHFENILFELDAVDYSPLRIFILLVIRFWEIRKFLKNGLR
jgi:hypothetical protein